jgi:ADP-heptose:LPS heptosyltransferase
MAGQLCPDPAAFIEYPEQLPEVRRHLALMAHLGYFTGVLEGAETESDRLEFPLHPIDAADLAALELNGLDVRRFVCFHPGARAEARRWSPKKFAAVADRLAADGLQVVLTGSETEAGLARAVQQAMHYPAINLAGKTSLGALAVLLTKARLLVCNDTGVSHLAAALQTPSVVIYTASDPKQWAPLNRELHHAVQGDPEPSSEAVLAQVTALLSRERAYA